MCAVVTVCLVVAISLLQSENGKFIWERKKLGNDENQIGNLEKIISESFKNNK